MVDQHILKMLPIVETLSMNKHIKWPVLFPIEKPLINRAESFGNEDT